MNDINKLIITILIKFNIILTKEITSNSKISSNTKYKNSPSLHYRQHHTHLHNCHHRFLKELQRAVCKTGAMLH